MAAFSVAMEEAPKPDPDPEAEAEAPSLERQDSVVGELENQVKAPGCDSSSGLPLGLRAREGSLSGPYLELTGSGPPPPPCTFRELSGWYLYDASSAAFSAVALPVFFPLLLSSLASQEAYIQLGEKATPQCSALPANSTAPCLVCIPGQGTLLNTTTGMQAYSQAQVTLGALHIDPVSFTTVMLGIAVILQLCFYITLGPLADFGYGRKHMLMVATVLGSAILISCLCLTSPSLWWLSGVFLVLSAICFGLARICFQSYLAVLVEASPKVLHSSTLPKQKQLEVREQVSNRTSLMGVVCAAVGSAACMGCAAAIIFTTPRSLQLRLAIAMCGIWWIVIAQFGFFWLKPRPGPPIPTCGLSVFAGWRRLILLFKAAARYRQSLWFLLCFFMYADGYNTVVQVAVLYSQRVLCFSSSAIILMVITAYVGEIVGSALAFLLQRWTKLGNKTMLVLSLLVMVPLPLWALLGYLTPPSSIGLKQQWEMFVFSGWFGLTVGPTLSFSRVVFIDMIPVGTEGVFFSLYLVSEKGSAWLGAFIAAIVIQFTGSMRPPFAYIFVVMVVPIFILIFKVNHKQGLVEAGRVKEHHLDATFGSSSSSSSAATAAAVPQPPSKDEDA